VILGLNHHFCVEKVAFTISILSVFISLINWRNLQSELFCPWLVKGKIGLDRVKIGIKSSEI
jgi:hypothetical protein